MAFIVSPIQNLGCPTVLLNKGIRTDYSVTGDPDNPIISENSMTFATSSNVYTYQLVKFAICGVSNLSFSYNGLIETNDSGFDVLKITVKGIDVNFSYERESVQGAPGGYVSVSGSDNVDLDNDNPCGYLVDISFDTGDSNFNDGVFYSVNLNYI